MRNDKQPTIMAIKALMERADDCLALAKSHHLQAEKQHEGTSRHRNADRLEYKAEMLEALACSLKADAVKISEII